MSILECVTHEGILTLTLRRPDKLNALNHEVLTLLKEALEEAHHNSDIRALMITGTQKAFCAGADIDELAVCNAETGYQFAQKGQAIFRQLETLGKPSLACVNGYAFGGGCELAMAATLRIASTNARFGQPEVKLGVIPGYGGTQRLARLVGKGRALDICLTGRFIDAQTALNWGLVSEVVEPEHLLKRGYELLQTILTMAPCAVKSVMEVIDYGYNLSLPEALHLEAMHFAKMCATEDKTIGTQAFLAKKTADFKGV